MQAEAAFVDGIIGRRGDTLVGDLSAGISGRLTGVVEAAHLPGDLDRGAAQFNISSPGAGPDLEIGPAMVVNVDEEGFYRARGVPWDARLVDGRPAILAGPGSV